MGNVVEMKQEPVVDPTPIFDDFWVLYPRKEARKDALKAWGQIRSADHLTAIVACASWRKVWAGRDTQFIPLAATWLRGERYTDEIPREFLSTSSASHVAAALPASVEREAMPEHVKALIAKLRGRK